MLKLLRVYLSNYDNNNNNAKQIAGARHPNCRLCVRVVALKYHRVRALTLVSRLICAEAGHKRATFNVHLHTRRCLASCSITISVEAIEVALANSPSELDNHQEISSCSAAPAAARQVYAPTQWTIEDRRRGRAEATPTGARIVSYIGIGCTNGADVHDVRCTSSGLLRVSAASCFACQPPLSLALAGSGFGLCVRDSGLVWRRAGQSRAQVTSCSHNKPAAW